MCFRIAITEFVALLPATPMIVRRDQVVVRVHTRLESIPPTLTFGAVPILSVFLNFPTPLDSTVGE
jgi:hypothetical protein